MPALRYPARGAGVSEPHAGRSFGAADQERSDRDSSITFWFRRCTLQSRILTAHAVP